MIDDPRLDAVITVGMPIYNGIEYVEEALAALAAQTFPDFVVLISDNCSTDGTSELLRQWADKDRRFVVYRQITNIGPANNYEWLLAAARSPFFMFAAYDDRWSPNYLDVLHAALIREPRFAMAAAMTVKTDPDGREDRRLPFIAQPASRLRRIARNLRRSQAGWFYGLHRTDAMRVAHRIGYDFALVWAADFLTILWFVLADAVTGSNEAIFYQRQTAISESRYKPKTLATQWRLLSRFLAFTFAILRDAPIPAPAKLALVPAVLGFVNAKAWKFRRLLRSVLLYPFARLRA